MSDLPRGLRNCNPGNIRRSRVRYRGEVSESTDRSFRQFVSMEWGYRAIFVLLDTYRSRYGLATLERMIARWAPPAENDTQAYVRQVAEATGIDPHREIDTHDGRTMIAVAAAIARVENGREACMDEVRAGWRLFAADRLPKTR